MERRFPETAFATVRAAFLVALLLIGTGCGRKAVESVDKPAELPTIVADTAAVARRTIEEELVIRGSIAALPNEDVRVSALVAGRVDSVTVAEGDAVQRGQVIAELDRRPFDDQRRQAAAALEQAKAQVENARLNLQRNQQLFDRGIAAGKEVEDARAQLASASASLEQTAAALNAADRQIERVQVRSPITGQVVKRMISIGEQVDGTGAQPIAQIANLDRVELLANVPAEYLPRIKIGQTSAISSDTLSGRTLTGTVLAVAPAVDPATNATLVRIRIPNPGGVLRVGMFAEARVRLGEHTDALVIPPSALVRDERGTAVYVAAGDVAQRTSVTVGLEKLDAIEILTGLTTGQTVLISSVYGLGDKVKLAKK